MRVLEQRPAYADQIGLALREQAFLRSGGMTDEQITALQTHLTEA